MSDSPLFNRIFGRNETSKESLTPLFIREVSLLKPQPGQILLIKTQNVEAVQELIANIKANYPETAEAWARTPIVVHDDEHDIRVALPSDE